MKYKTRYKILCRAYTYSGEECPQLNEYLREINARFFYIENGFVGIWTKHNRNQNQDPDISVNVKDVLTIEWVGEEKE